MVRVSRRPASALAKRASSRSAHRTARKHKVILESVTREKKKLRTVMSFEAKAPPGYTFIPAGNPQLTTACKELCRRDGLKVFAVTTTPHMHTHNLSQHVHRIGYHFPSTVVATICMDLGLYLTATGKAVPFQGISDPNMPKRAESEASQITINTEARDVLKDLFPNIPDNDLNQIIKTAFQKGQRKVGTAVELPLARRSQLAVVAHIRHVYTDYDRLLKTTSFHEARSLVEEPTLARLVEWRGDDENGKPVLEDVFREVIVISDDEDSDTEEDLVKHPDRDYSVEVISSNPRVEDLQTRPVNYGTSSNRDIQLDLSEDDAPPGFRFVRHDPKKAKIDRRGFSRYQAWDRAINRYRNTNTDNGQKESRNRPLDHRRAVYASGQSIQEPARLDIESFPQRVTRHQHSSAPPLITSHPVSMASRPKLPVLNPSIDHHQTKLFPVTESPFEREIQSSTARPLGRTSIYQGSKGSDQQDGIENAPVFVSGPKEIFQTSGSYTRHHSRASLSYNEHNINIQDRVLPSIETPLATDNKSLDTTSLDHLARRMSGGFSIRSMTPHQAISKEGHRGPAENNVGEQATKRRRLVHFDTPRTRDHRHDAGPTTSLTEPFSGARYIPVGYSSPGEPVPGDGAHLFRNRAVPAELPYIGEIQPRTTADPLYRSHYDIKPGMKLQGERRNNPEGQPPSLSRPPNARYRRRSPEQFGSPKKEFSGFPDSGCNAIPQVQPSSFREQPVYESMHRDDMKRVSDGSMHRGPRCTRANEHVIVSSDVPARGHYAEDFVRTIDIRDPVSTEDLSDARPRRSQVTKVHTLPTLAHHREPYISNLPSTLAPRQFEVSHSGQRVLTTHEYPPAEYREPIYPGSKVYDSSTPTSHYDERRRDGPCDDSRPSEYQQPASQAHERSQPVYVRAVDRHQSQRTVLEGRPIIIVD